MHSALFADGSVEQFVHGYPVLVVLVSIVLIAAGVAAVVLSREAEFGGCLVMLFGVALAGVGVSFLGDLFFGWRLLM